MSQLQLCPVANSLCCVKGELPLEPSIRKEGLPFRMLRCSKPGQVLTWCPSFCAWSSWGLLSPSGTVVSDRTLASSLQLSYPAQSKQKELSGGRVKKRKCSNHQNKLVFARLRDLQQPGMVQQRPGAVYVAWSWHREKNCLFLP